MFEQENLTCFGNPNTTETIRGSAILTNSWHGVKQLRSNCAERALNSLVFLTASDVESLKLVTIAQLRKTG